ncbi:MAG: protein kinase domain-containing protein [Solirubrobacteraceae bacterium]
MPAPSVGTQLGGYRIEALLGRGGMGVVYRAEDLRLGRKVALKLLASDLTEDARFRSRFLAESRLAASIDHAGIVPIYEAGESDGHLYIAMRYVEGTDLGTLLRREGPMEPRRAVELVAQLGQALDAAHWQGLVHRDVKPSNALIAVEGADEHVYLADFGLTRHIATAGGVTAGDRLVGTVDYLAPECIAGKPADGRADIYSLGCVLFEALTGDVPFPRDSEVATVYAHLEDEPPRPSERRPGVPVALDAVVSRAMAKDPERRWQSGAELAAAARAALAGAPDARPPLARAGRGPPHRSVAALAVLAALALVAGLLAGHSGASGKLTIAAADAVAVIDPGKRSLISEIPVGASPAQMTAGAGALWVANTGGGTVSRLDPRTRTVTQAITVGNGPSAVAVGAGGVWAVNTLDDTLSWISPVTNAEVKKVPLGNGLSGVCVAAGAVWVASTYDSSIFRYDPVTSRTTTIHLDDQPTQLACGGGSVWAASQSSGSVTQVSTAGRGAVVGRIAVGRGPSAVAWGHGALWVANTDDGTVSRVDGRRGVQTAVIALASGSDPTSIVVGPGGIWVASERAGTVARIDPARNAAVKTLTLGNRPQGLAVVGGALWVSVRAAGAQHRGGTLRVVNPVTIDGFRPTVRVLDPAHSYDGWPTLSLTNDGLVTFRRVGGQEGNALVPDLAVSVPTPTDGGRTYAFRLRRGVRYSTGAPVRASDVRREIERVLRIHYDQLITAYYTGIRGAPGCVARPTHCDLSAGIQVDDTARTITFRLTRPDPTFLYKLALPSAVAVPPATGTVPLRRLVPATGPYMVAGLSARAPLRLVRNPRFRPVDGRPDGYPDAITIDCCADPQGALRAVQQGRADIVGGDVGLEADLARQLDAIATRYAGRLHTAPVPATRFAFLNTHVPPFDDLDVRRALNYAVDRRAFVAIQGGEHYAQATCQFLPTNFPGHRPYCPYTARAGGGRPWSAPDLARARRLIARSHTRGMRVTVLTGHPVSEADARQLVKLLQRLGYRARLRVLPQSIDYFRYISDSRHRAQIGPAGWFSDFPDAAGFMALFRCDTFAPADSLQANYSEFCDPRADRLAQRASRVAAGDPRADALWAQVDKRVTDQAAVLPLINPKAVFLVSRRAGNFQYSRQWGVLYDQLWVR